jgi:hypothetical protein
VLPERLLARSPATIIWIDLTIEPVVVSDAQYGLPGTSGPRGRAITSLSSLVSGRGRSGQRAVQHAEPLLRIDPCRPAGSAAEHDDHDGRLTSTSSWLRASWLGWPPTSQLRCGSAPLGAVSVQGLFESSSTPIFCSAAVIDLATTLSRSGSEVFSSMNSVVS